MEAKELMIGDWVSYNANVFNDDIYTPTQPLETIQIKSGEDIDLAIEVCYAPIHLTEEILKTNGFEMKANNHYYIGELFKWSASVYLFDDGSVITITNDLEHRGVNKIHICDNGYVHILQHALRLCGLNELADNFKITP